MGLLAMSFLVSPLLVAGAGLTGTFIQLNRDAAQKTTADWRSDLQKMKKVGITELIVQWTAENDIVYFQTAWPACYTQKFAVVEKILEAAADEKFQVVLGLHNDPGYWTEITAPNSVLRDYFLVRVGQNENLQKALLKQFGDRKLWTGYYIPDEIDDLNWREPDRRAMIKNYIALMAMRLHTNDSQRTVAVSAFFRGRTTPPLVADIVKDTTATSGVSEVLIQDGAGLADPPNHYLSVYYEALKKVWPATGAPRLVAVVEAFEQTSAPDKPFSAVPAPPERVLRQIQIATPYFDDLVLFSFLDYVDPDRGPVAARIYESLIPTR